MNCCHNFPNIEVQASSENYWYAEIKVPVGTSLFDTNNGLLSHLFPRALFQLDDGMVTDEAGNEKLYMQKRVSYLRMHFTHATCKKNILEETRTQIPHDIFKKALSEQMNNLRFLKAEEPLEPKMTVARYKYEDEYAGEPLFRPPSAGLLPPTNRSVDRERQFFQLDF